MKKKTMILLTAVLCASVGALVMFLNRPYKPVSLSMEISGRRKLLMEVLYCWNFIMITKAENGQSCRNQKLL